MHCFVLFGFPVDKIKSEGVCLRGLKVSGKKNNLDQSGVELTDRNNNFIVVYFLFDEFFMWPAGQLSLEHLFTHRQSTLIKVARLDEIGKVLNPSAHASSRDLRHVMIQVLEQQH